MTTFTITQSSLTKPSVAYIDFASTPLAKWYSGDYALVVDNLLTPEECENLITLAESTESEDGKGWQPAKLQRGPVLGDQVLDTSYRFNDRILRFDHDAARQIYERVLPVVEKDIGVIQQGSRWGRIVGEDSGGIRVQGTWKLVGLNERLSFLRYGPGHFFKEHFDGRLDLPDGRKSRVTIQVYLNGSDTSTLEGGATRFYEPGYWKPKGLDTKIEFQPRCVDVAPKTGRALIFQQKGLYHSGEMVNKGLKYTMRTDFMFEQTDST
ncbi:hypothetical protein FB446DRAFT_639973 [Lentinula raphanica]|uniref:Prolyl 4-hydroxylase alpha subunit domain-containing protein n=1 Tax=Lentinula raphanica TaxID=153919 RepID=A0AA38UDA8_9AGAR|nr:hypothetical protein FB446DRAFT_639973 [Lentinula raphanica]KAJ3837689.1 hypothetical protein F5878DRAFT_538930 [Lentinula raphanica]